MQLKICFLHLCTSFSFLFQWISPQGHWGYSSRLLSLLIPVSKQSPNPVGPSSWVSLTDVPASPSPPLLLMVLHSFIWPDIPWTNTYSHHTRLSLAVICSEWPSRPSCLQLLLYPSIISKSGIWFWRTSCLILRRIPSPGCTNLYWSLQSKPRHWVGIKCSTCDKCYLWTYQTTHMSELGWCSPGSFLHIFETANVTIRNKLKF